VKEDAPSPNSSSPTESVPAATENKENGGSKEEAAREPTLEELWKPRPIPSTSILYQKNDNDVLPLLYVRNTQKKPQTKEETTSSDTSTTAIEVSSPDELWRARHRYTCQKAAEARDKSMKIWKLKVVEPSDTSAQEEVHPGDITIPSDIPRED
jgi:hypothetical protein